MKRIALTLISAALALGSSHADVIGWNFSDLNATFDSGTPSNYSVSDFSLGNSLGTVSTPANGSSVSGSYAGASGGGNFGNAVKTGALDTAASSFYQVTFTPAAGFQVQVTDFDFGMRSTATGSQSFALYSSIDGFATAIFTGASGNNSAWSFKNNAAFNLSSSAGTAITFRLYTYGGTGNASTGTENNRIDDVAITLSAVPSGPANNDTVITAATNTASFSRVMQNTAASQNVTLNKTGANATTFAASASGDASTSTPTGNIAGATGSVNVGLNTTTTGAKTGTVTVDNTATTSNAAGQGSLDPNDVINVAGTVVANRTVTANSVNLGKVFTSANVSGTTTLTTTGADDKFTRITTSGSAVSNGGVTIDASNDATFNSATTTADRTVSAGFSTSGAKNVTVNIGVTGEGLAGENAQQNVGVNVTADVYERAALSTNNSSPLDDGGTVTIDNAIADGSQRASAQIASQTVTAGWSVTGLGVGTDIAENSGVVGTVGFNSVGKLNGVHAGTLVVGFQYSDSSIQGAGANPSELAARTWTFSHTVSGNVSNSGSAGVDAGGSFAGFGLISATAAGTQANLLAGTAGSATNVTMDFSTINPGAANDLQRVSDVLALNGTDLRTVVLQLSYNEGDLGSISEDDLRLGWLSGGQWVLAIDGNVGGTPNFVLGAWNSSYGLGTYGLDTTTNTVWAVIDHNSDFAVIAVPEPGTYALLGVAGATLLIFRRRKAAASL